MKRIFLLLILSFFLTGCGIIVDMLRVGYEDYHSVPKGSVVRSKSGLFKVKVPEDYMYAEQNRYALELEGKGFWGMKYLVFTRPLKKLPAEIHYDLEKTKDWIVNDFIKSKAKDVPQVLFSEKRKFQGEEALYFESFFQTIAKETKWRTRIDRNAIGYTNLIFYHNEHLYWLYYSKIYEFAKQADPQIKPEMREKFEAFLSNFSFLENKRTK